jgi:N-acetylglucosaminyldiphosphoundecaprenol N-acetyl-beta-D-mannosaminyltransferase
MPLSLLQPPREMRHLLDRISVVPDRRAKLRVLLGLLRPDRPTVLSFLNQHAFNLAHADPRVRDTLLGSDYLLRDGVGIEVAMTLLRQPAGENLNGTDLLPELLRMAPGRTVAIFGTREPWLGAAASTLRSWGLVVVATHDGFDAQKHYLATVRRLQPDIVLLGMGMPKQETLAIAMRRELRHPCLIINGGAILDFLADRFIRAPRWVRALRAEWLFRLAQEPKRLFKRYLTGGALFGARILFLALDRRLASPAE